MYKEKLFVCRGCVNPLTSTWCTSPDIGDNANLESVDKFRYLGDMLSVDGDADAAVETRIQLGWNKFKQLVSLLTDKDISLNVRGKLYSSCVRSSILLLVHSFNGLFSRTTWVSLHQRSRTILVKPILIYWARDSEWQWHQLDDMQICISPQTDNHASIPPLSFLQAGCPSCRPTNSVKALK